MSAAVTTTNGQIVKYILEQVMPEITSVMKGFPPSHNLRHVLTVSLHTLLAIDSHGQQMPWFRVLTLNLGALLHELGDAKLKKYLPQELQTQVSKEDPYQLVKAILKKHAGFLTDDVVTCVKLASTSTSGFVVPPELPIEFTYPGDADRLEAIGHIGILRCFQYTTEEKRPLYVDETARCKTREDVLKVATPERFESYLMLRAEGKTSLSLMDHVYDKLLHVHKMRSDNSYLKAEAEKRRDIMIEFCLLFGEKDTMTETMVMDFVKGHV